VSALAATVKPTARIGRRVLSSVRKVAPRAVARDKAAEKPRQQSVVKPAAARGTQANQRRDEG